MIKACDLRKGKTIVWEGQPAVIHEAQHVAKGNKRSYMQTKIKYVKTGVMMDVRFNVDDRVEIPFMETKEYDYLYKEGDKLIVMDLESFDQIPIAEDVVGESVQWLKPNTRVTGQLFNSQLISLELPNTVELTIKDTPPVVKGATATNQSKDAIVETGARIRVPPFCEPGMVIRVDTRTGQYLERANK